MPRPTVEETLNALRSGVCPLCGVPFNDEERTRCDHEAGWYREWLALLSAHLDETKTRAEKLEDFHDSVVTLVEVFNR